jgi:serine protease Do
LAIQVIWVAVLALSPVALLAQDPTSSGQIVTRETFRNVAKIASPAVVNIRIKSNFLFGKQSGGSGRAIIPPMYGFDEEMREYLERLFEQQMPNMSPRDEDAFRYARSASGVIVRPDGYIVTSNHVVAEVAAEDIEVSLPDGRSFDRAEIVGQDDLTDLAVLKVAGENLPTLSWGDSDQLQVGDMVVAIGNPLDFNNTVSEGIVSAKHRVIRKAPIEDLIQTTAMINPGNSGGALVNLDGQLVGINMAIATSTGLWSGLGFAIPSRTAKQVTDQIIERGKVARGYLGIEMERLTNSLAKQLSYTLDHGIVVRKVRPGSAAERAGLQRYDIVAKVNGREIKDIYDMHSSIGARSAGEEVTLEVWRDEGKPELVRKEVSVKLDERPSQKELEASAPEPKAPGVPVERGLLGLKVSPAPDGKGLVVDEVEEGSPAYKVGVRRGDLILQANKKDVNSVADLQQALRGNRSGAESHLFYIERDGASVFAQIPAK